MATVDDMILHYELVQEPGQAGAEKIRRIREEIGQAQEPVRRDDELHPAWIVFGALLVAAEYFWLLVVAS